MDDQIWERTISGVSVALQIAGVFLLSMEALGLERFARLRAMLFRAYGGHRSSGADDLDPSGRVKDRFQYFLFLSVILLGVAGALFEFLVFVPALTKLTVADADGSHLKYLWTIFLLAFGSLCSLVLLVLSPVMIFAQLSIPVLGFLERNVKTGTTGFIGLALSVMGLSLSLF